MAFILVRLVSLLSMYYNSITNWSLFIWLFSHRAGKAGRHHVWSSVLRFYLNWAAYRWQSLWSVRWWTVFLSSHLSCRQDRHSACWNCQCSLSLLVSARWWEGSHIRSCGVAQLILDCNNNRHNHVTLKTINSECCLHICGNHCKFPASRNIKYKYNLITH